MRFKTLLMTVALAAIAFAPIGCTAAHGVPKTKIKFGDFTMEAPKDVDLSGLQFTKTTNGIQVTLQRYKAEMNPSVIEQSMSGQAKLVEAGGNAAAQSAGAVAQTFLNQFAPRPAPPQVQDIQPPPLPNAQPERNR